MILKSMKSYVREVKEEAELLKKVIKGVRYYFVYRICEIFISYFILVN